MQPWFSLYFLELWHRAGGKGRLCLRSHGIAADDLSHYDVTSEPVREISMAAKRWRQESFSSEDCSKDLTESDQQTVGIK